MKARLPPGGYPEFMTKHDLLETEHRLKSHLLWVTLGANLLAIGVLTGVALGVTSLT